MTSMCGKLILSGQGFNGCTYPPVKFGDFKLSEESDRTIGECRMHTTGKFCKYM